MDRTLTRGTTDAGQAKLRRREALLAKANVAALPQSVAVSANADEHAVAQRARAKLKPVAQGRPRRYGLTSEYRKSNAVARCSGSEE